MSEIVTGRLLVATPTLLDPNFFRAVVLILEQGEDGALGVTLNRGLDVSPGEYLPAWADRISQPDMIFSGGPVQRDMAVGLAWRPGVPEEEAWSPVLGGVGLIDLSSEPETIVGLEGLRVFSGYAGWGSDQLEAELAMGSWFVVDATPADAFTEDPDRLWHDVLRRQPNRLALFADYPPNPSLN